MTDVTFPGAFIAGLLSFLSPCVLPLVPPYMTYLAGATLDDLTGQDVSRDVRRRALICALCFVGGLATIFISLGASASFLGGVLAALRRALAGLLSRSASAGILPEGWANSVDPFYLLAGILIIIMGLHFLGVFRIALMYREARFEQRPAGAGPLGAWMMGMAFAFGWTPCIGPMLGALMAIAGRETSVVYGVELLFVYTLGLGLPFIAAALAMNPFMAFLRRFRAHLGYVEKAMGALLVLAGIGFLTGGMANFSIWLLQAFPGLGKLG